MVNGAPRAHGAGGESLPDRQVRQIFAQVRCRYNRYFRCNQTVERREPLDRIQPGFRASQVPQNKARAALERFRGGAVMRRWLILCSLAILGFSNAGCLLNAYSPDPTQRTTELINQSENLRQIRREIDVFWMTDQPSHLTPEHLDGGIGP
jgi:hypothetical protein